MRVHLDYGRTGLDADLPGPSVVGTLNYRAANPLPDPQAELARVLAEPQDAVPLSQLASQRKDACILICDVTRPVPNELILLPLLQSLEQAGIDRENILILVATGLHRPNVGNELVEMVGQHIVDHYRIENHDGQALQQHTYLGESPRGVPIWIDSRYVNAELKIAVGLIEPHFMAGFSGGRKLICPGVAAMETVRAWHSPRFLEHPCADTGVLAGNPVHEENTWIARCAGCDFIVNVVLDAERRPLKFVAGDMETAFMQGCEFVEGLVTDSIPEPVDIVVTSSAGYPLDTTFYQSVKGMVAALPIVRPGGTIVLAASMSEGIGSEEFQSLFREHAGIDEFAQAISDESYFVMDQWQLEEMAKVLRKARVKVVTDGLSAETLKSLYVESSPNVEIAVAECMEDYGPQATIAVIPKGPYVVAKLG